MHPFHLFHPLNVKVFQPVILRKHRRKLFTHFHLLLFKLQDDLPVLPFSMTEGREVLESRRICDVEVHDAAEVRTHGGKGNAAAGTSDEVRFLLCNAPNFIFLCLTIAVDIEDKEWGTVEIILGPHDGLEEMLDGVQCFSVPTNEPARIGGEDINAPEVPFLYRENIRVRNVEEIENLAEGVLEECSIHRIGRIAELPMKKPPITEVFS